MGYADFEPRLIVSEPELDRAFANAHFGTACKREVLTETLFSFACGFSAGSTATRICRELGLTGVGQVPALTKKGKRYLFGALHPCVRRQATEGEST